MVELDVSGTTRVLRTFAFVDLSAFTALTENEGDRRAVEVLDIFRAAVRDIASFRGVRVAKWMGDGAMLVGVETEPLVAAIIDIERRIADSGCPLALRAGVTVGPVILFEGDDYIGHAVNMASRLCDEAAPREILAPAAMIDGHDLDALVEPIGSRKVRGLDEPIELVRLIDAN